MALTEQQGVPTQCGGALGPATGGQELGAASHELPPLGPATGGQELGAASHELPPEAISNLRLAVVLLLAIVPHSTRYEAERAVIAEFMTRAEGKLRDVRDAAGLLRGARTKLERELSIKD